MFGTWKFEFWKSSRIVTLMGSRTGARRSWIMFCRLDSSAGWHPTGSHSKYSSGSERSRNRHVIPKWSVLLCSDCTCPVTEHLHHLVHPAITIPSKREIRGEDIWLAVHESPAPYPCQYSTSDRLHSFHYVLQIHEHEEGWSWFELLKVNLPFVLVTARGCCRKGKIAVQGRCGRRWRLASHRRDNDLHAQPHEVPWSKCQASSGTFFLTDFVHFSCRLKMSTTK